MKRPLFATALSEPGRGEVDSRGEGRQDVAVEEKKRISRDRSMRTESIEHDAPVRALEERGEEVWGN